MEKLSDYDTQSTNEKKRSVWTALTEAFKGERNSRMTDKAALIYDLVLFSLGFVLSRCHLVFGARPIGLAFVSVLPVGVWPTLFGSVIGALTLGFDGMVLSATAAIVVFLRAAISVGDDGAGRIFKDNLLLRVSVSVLGGFVVALYEVLVSGLNETTLLFGLTMIISSPILTFLFSGIFSAEIDANALFFGSSDILSLAGKEEKERRDLIFFRISSLSLLFFISLSLKGVDIFGISLSFVFSSLITLAVAKRFGALGALTVGFVTSLGISSSLSVSFALLGLGAGIMFGFGTGYAIVAGGFALGAWSSYTAGLVGFLSTVPEYIIAASVGVPILKHIGKSEIINISSDEGSTAEDMVGTMALAYQNKYSGSLDMLELSLASLCSVVRKYASAETQSDSEKYETRACELLADEYELIAKLINSARTSDEAERRVDDSVTEALSEIFARYGFDDGTIRVFGERRRQLLLAGDDEDGSRISSKEMRREIEDALGVKLSTPEYFRKDKTVLMRCGVRRRISVEIATTEASGNENEVSGDSICAFESEDDRFFALISDGMGSGDVAKATSSFVTSFMRAALNIGAGRETIIHMLNHTIRSGREECSASFDLFDLDLLTGEATFIKSGAAPSYVKRDSSIFRIRSQTAPLGVLGSIDSEKIKVEVRPGDYVIMLSDGIADSMEDAPWLLLLLGEKTSDSPGVLAEKILSCAREHSKTNDDMSVVVMKIEEI